MALSLKDSKFLIGSMKRSELLNDRSSQHPSNNIGEEGADLIEKEYQFQRRICRQFSINCRPNKDNKFHKVIIPYNFDLKKYWINKKEIEFYESKKYLEKKLMELNDNPAFNIDKVFEPKLGQRLFLYMPTLLLSIVVLYFALIFTAFFSFNPIIIFTLFTWFQKGFSSLQMFKFILFEKFKIREIHIILNRENESPFCVEHKLRWILGKSGYWLEVQKLIE